MYRNSRGAYIVLVGRPEGKRLHERPRHEWEDNIKMDFQVRWGMDWIKLAQYRDKWRAFVNSAMNFCVS
jgi:hypothetical protein